MRKFVIHALHYYPSTRPVCKLYLDLIKSMMARNYQVIVITAKNGQVAKSVYGETIIYVNNFGFLNERTIFRFLDYISFYSMSLFIASKYLLIYGRPRGVVINVVKSGYGISTFIAMVYKKLYTLNIVFWVLDRYPDIIFQNIKKYNILFKLLKYIEIYSLNNMNKVVFETENDRQDYMNWNGSSEPILIRTWSSIDGEILHYSKPQFWDELDLKNKNIIIYSGNIGFSFDQDKLIKLANSYKDIIFIILGVDLFPH